MLYLLPFDSIELPVDAPIDPTIDRVLLAGWVLVWAAALAAGARQGPTWKPIGLIGVFGFLLLVVGLLSVFVNLGDLDARGLTGGAMKRYALFLVTSSFFIVVVTSLRSADIPGLVLLLLGVAFLCALGVIYQYRLKSNLFFAWTQGTIGGVTEIAPAPAEVTGLAREKITGPTRHGLATVVMLCVAAPFALTLAFDALKRRRRIIGTVLFLVLVVAALSTLRRTAVIAPLALLLVFLVFSPRQMLRLAPLTVPAYFVGLAMAPGAAGRTLNLFSGSNQQAKNSTMGRTEDYLAVHVDVLNSPWLGRGFGTYQPDANRVLDNQYLGLLLQVGVLGVLCYLAVLIATGFLGYRIYKRARPEYALYGLAAMAACAVIAMSSVLFDLLAFPQASYAFLLVAAFVVILAYDKDVMLPRNRPRLREAPAAWTNGASHGNGAARA